MPICTRTVAARAATVVIALVLGGASVATGQCIVNPYSDRGFVQRADENRILGTVQAERYPDHVPPTPTERPRRLELKPGGKASLNRSVGYVISVEKAAGNAAELLALGSHAVMFRWGGVDDFCQWEPPLDTLNTGSRQQFIAILRPDSLWVGDLPTFDVPPKPLGEYPGIAARRPAFLLAEYVDFLSARPTLEEWQVDCRPGTLAVQAWLDAHAEASKYPPFNIAAGTLRKSCDFDLVSDAADLERWDAYDAPLELSEALDEWLTEEGCQDLTEIERQPAVAFRGNYLPISSGSAREQWLVLCVTDNHWRILVVLPEPPAEVHELASMAGSWDWLLSAAPAEYFGLMSAREFTYKEPRRVQRPGYDVVLLSFTGAEDDEKLAFFWTDEGWQRVVVRCCYWPGEERP